MALYLVQATYTAESVAAQIKDPQDRIEAIRPFLEAAGGRIVAAGFPLGESAVVIVADIPEEAAALAIGPLVFAGGSFSQLKGSRLLSSQEWTESLRTAQGLVAQYQPAR